MVRHSILRPRGQPSDRTFSRHCMRYASPPTAGMTLRRCTGTRQTEVQTLLVVNIVEMAVTGSPPGRPRHPPAWAVSGGRPGRWDGWAWARPGGRGRGWGLGKGHSPPGRAGTHPGGGGCKRAGGTVEPVISTMPPKTLQRVRGKLHKYACLCRPYLRLGSTGRTLAQTL